MSLCKARRLIGLKVVLVLGVVAGSLAWAEEKHALHSALKPVPRTEQWWQKMHNGFLERAKKGDVDVLFLGDSITQGWSGSGKEVWKERMEPLKAANFGIGGDQTGHVLWRLKEGKELEGIQPKVVVLMIGTNNMHANTAKQIIEGVTAIVHELRHQRPHARVLLLGIFPRSQNAADPVRDKIARINEHIAKLGDDKHVRYLDIADKFLDPDGNLPKEIMPDFLHLSPKGYQIEADAIQPEIERLLKD